ncbi:hypothetical protein [Streptomyces sp. HUCO-GS316]|uniref:hypothetical protein n=1 Tax=Streptomyces sp. HUCO-GS316 TaxID=2692198 RepID=UPI001928C540|nr:hypothetical protein [Streptomyces sp. HUCO-GS316]
MAARRLGVSPRQVERCLAGTAKHPRRALKAGLEREVAKAWQPRVRQQAHRKAATSTGLTIETRARGTAGHLLPGQRTPRRQP